MANPAFPTVPRSAGIPPVLTRLFSDAATPLTSDTMDMSAMGAAQWGIMDDAGSLVLTPDSIVAFEAQKENRIANYPVEEGGFESYSKVEMPYQARVTITKGGTDAERTQFMDDVARICASTDVYTIMTPSSIYTQANLTRFGYTQAADQGATLLVIELTAEQVRLQATAAFSSSTAKTPAAADAVNNGPVQLQTTDFSDDEQLQIISSGQTD